jgi:hypothetical protein
MPAVNGSDGLARINGHPKIREPSRAAWNLEKVHALWEATEQLTGAGSHPPTP